MKPTFECGHPRTPENSIKTGVNAPDGSRYLTCKFCQRMRHMVEGVERRQARINAGLPVDCYHRQQRRLRSLTT